VRQDTREETSTNRGGVPVNGPTHERACWHGERDRPLAFGDLGVIASADEGQSKRGIVASGQNRRPDRYRSTCRQR